MRLAIDASRTASTQKTGVGWYCYHLLQHLAEVIPDDVGVVLYSDQPLPAELRPWPQSWQERVLKRRGPMWSQLVLANAVLRDRPDGLFVPAHVIPFTLALAPRSKRPRLVTTIHDVVFKQFPDSYSTRERWYADYATRLAVAYADRIIVPTQHVARELEQCYGCEREKVTVIHHGVSDPNLRIHPNAPNVRTEFGSFGRNSDHSDRYLLYVGRLECKKNVARMVEAFSRSAPQHTDLRLVLAGPPGFGYEDVRAAIARSLARDRIIETGWVDQRQYQQLLSAASAFLFPTLGEGFGLPILEAMAAGVPVITSTGGAHGEVAGGAALLVDPESTEEIAAAIDRTLRDANLRLDLVRRGQQRAAAFNWQRSAQATWCVLQSVLST